MGIAAWSRNINKVTRGVILSASLALLRVRKKEKTNFTKNERLMIE
jgi:hypothetical protein